MKNIIARCKDRLPTKEQFEKYIDLSIKVIFPDGEESFVNKTYAHLGASWDSPYWNERVVVIEMSENKDTVWVESLY